MNANAKFDAAFGRQAGVALDESILHFDRAAHRVDHTAKFDEASVPGSFHRAPVMRGPATPLFARRRRPEST
jgi:hypothetical protein